MINVLLATLTEVIDAQRDHVTGNAEAKDVIEAKKRFSKALHDLIDFRIQAAFDRRRSSQSQEMIAVADSINSNIKSTASTIRGLTALNSAPPPPKNPGDSEEMKKWKDAYEEWYKTKRANGLKIE